MQKNVNFIMEQKIYSVAFPFMGEYFYCDIPANYIADSVANDIMGDSMADTLSEHEGWFEYRFEHNGKSYMATFSYDSVKMFNVFEAFGNPESDDYDECIVAKDIPYIVLKIKQDKNVLYNVCDCI
jgi:hypothetical protein